MQFAAVSGKTVPVVLVVGSVIVAVVVVVEEELVLVPLVVCENCWSVGNGWVLVERL